MTTEPDRELIAVATAHSTRAWRAVEAVYARELRRGYNEFAGADGCVDDEDVFGARDTYALLVADRSNAWHEARQAARMASHYVHEIHGLIDDPSTPVSDADRIAARAALAAVVLFADRAEEFARTT